MDGVNGSSIWADVTNRAAVEDPNKPKPAGSNKLGKEEFVKLLLHQMQHQDPTNPMNSEAMVTQLAQFATLETMNSSKDTLEAILVSQAASQQTNIVNMVGKDVLYRTDKVSLEEGKTAAVIGSIELPAENVTVTITDAQGNPVRTIDAGPRAAGQVEIQWDGRNDRGDIVSPGAYTVQIGAADLEGNAIAVDQQSRGNIRGVSFKDGVPELLLGNVKIKLSDVVEINERSTQ